MGHKHVIYEVAVLILRTERRVQEARFHPVIGNIREGAKMAQTN